MLHETIKELKNEVPDFSKPKYKVTLYWAIYLSLNNFVKHIFSYASYSKIAE